MKILVHRSGGFAGLSQDIAALNTAEMSAAEAKQAEQMVRDVGFFDLPAAFSGGRIGADLFQYEITVIDGNRRHTVTFVDDDSPEKAPLRTLVDTMAAQMP